MSAGLESRGAGLSELGSPEEKESNPRERGGGAEEVRQERWGRRCGAGDAGQCWARGWI